MIEEHNCFDELVDKTGSDATFERATSMNFDTGKTSLGWVINLYRYTPSLRISTRRGYFVPTFCPICGERLIEEPNDRASE